MSDAKSDKKKRAVKFLLAPRPQKDPLAADIDAPQHVLVPKDGQNLEEIRQRLPDFDSKVFASKEQTKTGMLERAHNADGLTFDSDILEAMSKDFDFNDPNNVLDDDFMDQAGGLIEDEGEMLEGDMVDLDDMFVDEPEIVTFNKDDEDDMDGADSDDYDLDQECMEHSSEGKESKPTSNAGLGRKLILFKKKVNKESAKEVAKEPPKSIFKEPAPKTESYFKSARHLQDELNAHFSPQNQRILALKQQLQLQRGTDDDGGDDGEDISGDEDYDDEKTVFTNYSMTSSVMRRSQGLQQIDEHFERLFEKEYADDTEIGALDLNEVKGEELLTNIEQIRQLKNEVKIARKKNHGDDYEPEIVSDHHKTAIFGDEPGAEDEDLVTVEIKRRENRVDCESILTYNSNLYNHPKLIVEPRKRSISSRMEVDNDEIRSRSDLAQSIASTRASILSKLSIRPTNETSEDKRARKKALKVYRNERRQERKQNQQIFKSEQANLIKQQRTNKPALRLV